MMVVMDNEWYIYRLSIHFFSQLNKLIKRNNNELYVTCLVLGLC